MRKLSIIYLGTHVFYFAMRTQYSTQLKIPKRKTIFFEKTAEAATNYIVDYWLDGEESQNVG